MSGQGSLSGIGADPTWDERRPGPDPVAEARAILTDVIEEHQPAAVFTMFSGGWDSMVTAHIASQHPRWDGCMTAHTRFTVPEWEQHLAAAAVRFGWPLDVEYTSESYVDLVLSQGFPGPAMHWKMYQRLKERAFRSFTKRVLEERGGPVLLVGGRRKAESPRRLRRLTHPVEVADPKTLPGVVFVSPLFWWTKEERDDYALAHDFPLNPVKEAICTISGDCFCGAMADQDKNRAERRAIEIHLPEMHAQLSCLEVLAEAVGVWPIWGVKPPETYSRAMREQQTTMSLYACTGCEWRAEHDADAKEAA